MESILVACVPGILGLVFSWLTKEVVGYGDGIVLMILGMYLSLERLIFIGMIAFEIAGVVALVLLVIFRKKGSYRIPFVPFLCLAYGVEYWIRLGESGI